MGRPAGCSHDLHDRQVRHRRIMHLWAKGWEQQEIATELRIHIRTVQRYQRNQREGRLPRTRGPAPR